MKRILLSCLEALLLGNIRAWITLLELQEKSMSKLNKAHPWKGPMNDQLCTHISSGMQHKYTIERLKCPFYSLHIFSLHCKM